MGDTARAALYEAMMLGDGTTGLQDSFAAGSEARADIFQVLCTLQGYSSNKYFRTYEVPAGNGSTGCWYVGIHRRKTAQTPHCERTETSNGGVWCVTVPNSFAVFRRQGKTFVSGNTMVQGSAADIIKLAMIRCHRSCDEEIRLSLSIHDELVLIAPNDRLGDAQKLLRDAMLGPGIQKLLTVPMKIDMHVVQRWSDAGH